MQLKTLHLKVNYILDAQINKLCCMRGRQLQLTNIGKFKWQIKINITRLRIYLENHILN